MTTILGFDDAAATELSVCGGKGANLARLTQAGFQVPPGFVVTGAVYEAFVAGDTEFQRATEALDYGQPERLHEQCRVIRERLVELDLPEMIQDDLRARLSPLLDAGPVAVRSSSTLEDLAGAAFAGQHDTYLNVNSAEDVVDALRRCFASLWEDRAARYRFERGFSEIRPTMAVVVQAMVASEVAGVAFSMNPITGDLGEVVINSAYGLGETVVSGEGEVDQYVLNKETGELLSNTIGEKSHAIRGTETGTETVEIGEDRKNASSLSESELSALCALTRKVERYYAFPQDIEWGLAQGQLYLLQSRPITQFTPRWTRDESAERFPNVITPLTWDFTCEGFHKSLVYSLGLMGLPSFEGRWFDRFDDYIYGNQTAVQLFTGGEQVAFDSVEELRALVPVIREKYRWVQQLPITWARDLDWYLLTLGRLSAVDLGRLSDDALLHHIHEVDALGTDYFKPNIAISITQGMLHKILFRLLCLVMTQDKAVKLHDGLTCFCETKTGVVNNELHRLSVIIRKNEGLKTLILGTPRRDIIENGLLQAFPEFAKTFARFIEVHGHREVDFDAYIPPWQGQPWVVLENLRLMLQRDDAEDPADRERALRTRLQEAEKLYFNSVPEDLHFFASELLRLTRAYTALDDLEHYQTTRLGIPMRHALVEAGLRLQKRGVLHEPEDVFFLQKPTLACLLTNGDSDDTGRAEAQKNKSLYLEHRDQTPAWIQGETALEEAVDGEFLRGTPGSPGQAEGEVFLVHSVDDFPRFPAGSVLVARTTNPAWTPLFYTARAVITESGGPLSHGAVTAREVGLPAVMAVRGVLDTLENGTRVRVDGSNGTVSILDNE